MKTTEQHCRDLLTRAVDDGTIIMVDLRALNVDPQGLSDSDLTGMAALLESLLAAAQPASLRVELAHPGLFQSVGICERDDNTGTWRGTIDTFPVTVRVPAASENGRLMAGATPGVPDGGGA